MMDELPAIIHRLSLRLWCPEYRAKEDQEMTESAKKAKDEVAVDPFASPPQDAVDARGNVLDATEISNLSLDGGSEIHSLFSQKNLLRLAALTNSHRTLSLFTPSIRDAVFRAWAPSERGDSAGTNTPATPSLHRSQSSIGGQSTTYTFSNRTSDDGHGGMPSRPSLVNMNSATTGLSLGANRNSRSHPTRKKKNRVVNLRKTKTTDDVSESGESEIASTAAVSEPIIQSRIPEEPEDIPVTPPSGKLRFNSIDLGESPKKMQQSRSKTPEQTNMDPVPKPTVEPSTPIQSQDQKRPVYNHSSFTSYAPEKSATTPPHTPFSYPHGLHFSSTETPSGILEQAWIMKMASELSRRHHDEKTAREGFWSTSSNGDEAPPAYEPKAL